MTIKIEELNLLNYLPIPLKPGDHIACDYNDYTHHGIYDGKGFVYQVKPAAEKDPLVFDILSTVHEVIERVKLGVFTRGSAKVSRIIHSKSDIPRTSVLITASKLYKQNNSFGFSHKNCQEFATFCWTGQFIKFPIFKQIYLPN